MCLSLRSRVSTSRYELSSNKKDKVKKKRKKFTLKYIKSLIIHIYSCTVTLRYKNTKRDETIGKDNLLKIIIEENWKGCTHDKV